MNQLSRLILRLFSSNVVVSDAGRGPLFLLELDWHIVATRPSATATVVSKCLLGAFSTPFTPALAGVQTPKAAWVSLGGLPRVR
ncbi:hypothetical protein LZC95_26835 [Pendulispora brunnea]|uniref:Secreted protein n=1 Tax=Pendulispora brunnea TaxID=2905690 RepID=A0ABZ2JUC3_9BACT